MEEDEDMQAKFSLGAVVQFKDKTLSGANGLAMAGPFSISDIIRTQDHPIFKLLGVPAGTMSRFSYKLTDRNGNPVRVKSIGSDEPIDDYWVGESLLVPATLQ